MFHGASMRRLKRRNPRAGRTFSLRRRAHPAAELVVTGLGHHGERIQARICGFTQEDAEIAKAVLVVWLQIEFESQSAVRESGSARSTPPSTNASRQPEKPENSQVKTRGSASTLGLNPQPRATSLPTGENRRLARTCEMLRIRAREQPTAAVKETRARSWGGTVVAPRHGFEPRFTAPKAAVLPLDDRGNEAGTSPVF